MTAMAPVLLLTTMTVLGPVAPCSAQVDAAPGLPVLIAPADDVPPAARAFDARERRADPTIVDSRFVRVHLPALRDSRQAVRITLDGAERVVDVASRQRVLRYDSHVGTVRGDGGAFILASARDGVAAGTVWFRDRLFDLVHTGVGDVHVLREHDQSVDALPLEVLYADIAADALGSGSSGGVVRTNQSGTILDVMVFYTPRARSQAGGTSAIETAIVSAIARSNQTNQNTSVDMEFRLVHTAETNYTENGSTNDLTRFRSATDGIMDEVHALRTTYGGDLMHLITDPQSRQYCGVAYLMTRLSTSFRTAAFGVTLRTCMSGNVVSHEMGHNIGCHHDPDNAGSAIYPYAYGFRTADQAFRTVMSYSPGSRVDVWSSPNVQHQGYTMGVANSQDNARTIRNTMGTVASFYQMTALVFCPLSGGTAGQQGVPTLDGQGTVNQAIPIELTIGSYRPNAPGVLVIGASAINQPLLGFTLVPSPDITASVTGNGADIVFDASGLATLSGASVWFQAAFLDAAASQGVSASDGLKVIVP